MPQVAGHPLTGLSDVVMNISGYSRAEASCHTSPQRGSWQREALGVLGVSIIAMVLRQLHLLGL